MQVHPQSPQSTKGKSNMVYEEARRYPETDKWMVSVVVEQGRLVSKLEYRMTSYDPQSCRAFFEPVKTTKPMRLYAGKSKRQRPQITSITLLEYNQGRVTAEEQISLHPLSFSVNEPGIFCLFRDKSFWHMYVQVSMEDHSHEFNRKRDPQRWLQPLGFEVEVIMDDLPDKKSPNIIVEEVTTDDDDKDELPRKRTIEEHHDVITPPPMVRSTSSFPFHNSFTFTDWCVRKQPAWRGKFKKFGCNVRNIFHRTRF